MKPGQIFGILIIAVCILAAGFSLRGSIRPALTVKEAMASAGNPCEVYGEVVKGETHYDFTASRLDFRLKDKNGDTIPVIYAKPKPANFDQASHVKAVGAYRDGAFQADNLILKCPSKYIKEPPVPGKAPTSLSSASPFSALRALLKGA